MDKKIAVVLFFVRLFSSVGFGLLYSSLVLFLIQNLHMQSPIALAVVGIFIALHYSLAMINGVIAGRWVSYINALMIGIVLQAFSITLIYSGYSDIFLGCSLFLIGSLASSTPINMMITERFEAEDQRRERIFMWGYAAMNLGNILGYSIAGYFQLTNNFKNAACVSIFLMIMAFFLCLIFRYQLRDLHSKYSVLTTKRRFFGAIQYLLILMFLIFIIKQILIYSQTTSTFLIFGVAIALISFLVHNCKYNYKNGVIFFILALACLFFWSLYFLIPTGLTLFASYNTNRYVLGFLVPPAWLPNVNSFLIILGAPLLGSFLKRKAAHQKWTPIRKILIGLLSMSLAFFVLLGGILFSDYKLVALPWVILAYVYLTLAELFIAPVSFASVGRYVHRKKQNIMTGVGISILGLGALIASKISGYVQITGLVVSQTNMEFFKLFAVLFLAALGFSSLLFVMKRLLGIDSK